MNQHHHFKRGLLMSVFIGVWLCAGTAYSQSSGSYILDWNFFDGGGSLNHSPTYSLLDSVGQAFGAGSAVSDNYTNQDGFFNQGSGSGAAAQYVFTLIKRGTGSGAVTVNGVEIGAELTQVYDTGATLTLHAAAGEDSDFLGWNGGECSGAADCVMTLARDTVIAAEFAVKQHVITATKNEGGTLEPFGDVTLAHHADQTFTIVPEIGCQVADVLIDGVSVGVVTEYTFTDVTAGHSIQALFERQSYTITAAAGDGGSIAPSGAVSVKYGESQTFSITPNSGYEIQDVLIDGEVVNELETFTEAEGDQTIIKAAVTFTNVTANHAIEARFIAISGGGAYIREDTPDAEKLLTNPDDDWMCWAAAAANILKWTNWTTPLFDSAQSMFADFQEHWTNAASLMEQAWQWWFAGIEPENLPGWATVDVPGGGYFTDDTVDDYFSEAWATYDDASHQWSGGEYLMSSIEESFQDDYGVAAAVYNTSGGGHALTVAGYEYDEFGNYTGLWVTDSDDYLTGLKLLPVSLDSDLGLWYLGGEYSGWFIGGWQGLALKPGQSAVPEPGTLVFFVIGMLGFFALRRQIVRQRK